MNRYKKNDTIDRKHIDKSFFKDKISFDGCSSLSIDDDSLSSFAYK